MNTSTPVSSSATEASPFDDGAIYDLLLGNFPGGLDFYVELAKAARGPVLDVGCGTGRILLPCLQAGLDIEGLDLFSGMLERLREKAAALELKPTLHRADMAGFRLSRRFALIIIPFNAFVHNLTTETQLACLRACCEHLLPGGMLALDVSFPGLHWIGGESGTRVMEGEIPHPRDASLRIRAWDTRTFDRVAQVQHSFNEVEILDASGKVIAVHPSETSMRWTYKPEMELLLRAAGFARWQLLGDFDGRSLQNETDAMIVQAWTAPGAKEKS
jgi:SAM-dependent methyltransferase